MTQKFRELSLGDEKYFRLFIGRRRLKEDLFRSAGKIPLYSGSVVTPFGFVDDSLLADDELDRDYIIWGIDDALFDFGLIPKGKKFSVTDHCGVLKVLNPSEILPEYVFYELQSMKGVLGFGWSVRASMANMKKAKVKIPVVTDLSGKEAFDTEAQLKLSVRYAEVRKTIWRLKTIREAIQNTSLKVELGNDGGDTRFEEFPVKTLFDLSVNTNHSHFTKAFINENKGTIPVYSASKEENSVKYGYVKDNLKRVKYFEDALTWNIDGSVGTAFFRKGRFTLSEKVIPLIPREAYKDFLFPDYVKIILEELALEYGFHYSHKAGKSRIADIPIPLPMTPSSLPDIGKQKSIAEKYLQTVQVKDSILERLWDVIDASSNLSLI